MSLHTPVGLILGLASSVLVMSSPNQNIKFFSTIGIGLGLGVLASSEIGNGEHKKQIENLQKTVDIVDKQRRQAEQNQSFLTSGFKQKQESLETDLSIAVKDNQRQLATIGQLKSEIVNLSHELKTTKQKADYELREITKFSTSSGFEIANKTFEVQFKKLEGLMDGYKRNYPDLFEFFDNLEVEIDSVKSRAIRDLENYENVQSLQTIIDDGLTIQERIISKCSDIKIKALITVVRYLNDLIKDSVRLSEYQQHLEDLTEQAKSVIQSKDNETKSVALKWIESNGLTQQRYESEFTETLEQGKHLVTRNQELLNQIELMKRPLTWSLANRQDLMIGNVIIGYFEAKGIILDRAKADYDTWQSTLSFHVDRNARTITPGELNPEGEKLQLACHTLSPITFGWNSEEGLMTAHLHLAKKPVKPMIEADINKLWKTVDKFQSVVKNWERVRITGRSTAGKSPTAENVAVCILLSRGGTAELFNPRSGSKKDYWTIPTVGNSHQQSLEGIQSLAEKVNSQKLASSKFKLSIFDELDSTDAEFKEAKLGESIKMIIKQISHIGEGVIFLGQNANTAIKGIDRSDWNSVVTIHLASNIGDAITNSNQFTNDERSRLKAQADKLTEYCTNKNEELGLDILADPQAYRFGFVINDGKPYFIQLPNFGEYQYSLIAEALKCPKCDSINHRSNGVGKRQCKDCNHVFKG